MSKPPKYKIAKLGSVHHRKPLLKERRPNKVSPIFRYTRNSPRMDADRQAFLAGNVLPLPAHVKTLEVPTGNQGIPSKLQLEHGEANVTRTPTG